MNRFEFEFCHGGFVLLWNDEAKLTRVTWSPRSDLQSGRKYFLNTKHYPREIQILIERLMAYLETGEPLHRSQAFNEEIFSHIDQLHWSPFQMEVYKATMAIPHGETRSYAWIAQRIQRPLAVRAVGQALRKNPLLIFVPCHRVVSSRGDLGGFMGERDPNQPQLRLKTTLLGLEDRYLNPVFSFAGTPLSLGVAVST